MDKIWSYHEFEIWVSGTPVGTTGFVPSSQGYLGQQHLQLKRNLQIINQWSGPHFSDHWWPHPLKSTLGSYFSSQPNVNYMTLSTRGMTDNRLFCKEGYIIYEFLTPRPHRRNLKVNKCEKHEFLTTDSFRQTQKWNSFSYNLREQLKVSSLKALQHSGSLFSNLLHCRPIKKEDKIPPCGGQQPDTRSKAFLRHPIKPAMTNQTFKWH